MINPAASACRGTHIGFLFMELFLKARTENGSADLYVPEQSPARTGPTSGAFAVRLSVDPLPYAGPRRRTALSRHCAVYLYGVKYEA